MFISEKSNIEIMLHCSYLNTWHVQKPVYINLREVKKTLNQAEE